MHDVLKRNFLFILIMLSGCTNSSDIVKNVQPQHEQYLEACLSADMLKSAQLVFLGPVTYTVGDVWQKKADASGAQFNDMYRFSQISNDAALKPDQSIVLTGVAAKCTIDVTDGGKSSLSLGANAKILTALPLSATIGGQLQNTKVTKVSFSSISVDQIDTLPDYQNLFSSIPQLSPEASAVQNGGYYWAYAMVKVTDYTVSVSYTSDNGLNLAASATLPTTLSGNLNASVSVSKTANNEIQFSVAGPVYIAALLRPFGPGGKPQSAGGLLPQSTGDSIYASPLKSRG